MTQAISREDLYKIKSENGIAKSKALDLKLF